jgi:tRNA dimethylallyltransferase
MGPTGSGKSDLAVCLAERLNGEIVSVDSALVYRGLDIGTAKPDRAARRGVPHHLIDILDPAESYSTGRFLDDARKLMADIAAHGKMPILAGGTMLYFHALLHGLAELPPADPDIRRFLEEEAARTGWAALHAELARVDAEAARRIHPNDPQRIQRALEVYHATGKPLSELCAETTTVPLPCRPVKLVVAPASRAELHARLERRFRDMLARGLIDEVRTLFERGDLHESLPSIRAVGYRQVWGYLKGEYDLAALQEKGIAATRQLAKRQFTWLGRERDAHRYESAPAEALGERILADLFEGDLGRHSG